jgi:hypothetical protein
LYLTALAHFKKLAETVPVGKHVDVRELAVGVHGGQCLKELIEWCPWAAGVVVVQRLVTKVTRQGVR